MKYTTIAEAITHICKVKEALRYDFYYASPTITLKDSIVCCLSLLNYRGCLSFKQKIGLWLLK